MNTNVEMTRYLLIIAIQLISQHLFAQNTLTSTISKGEIIGVWQINSPRVGNGFSECFSFFKYGSFIYQYDPSDDTRNILSIKGKYRLEDNSLYLTIKYRIERLGGKIVTGAGGTDDYLFVFDNNKQKQVIENSNKELDPLIISQVNKNINGLNFFINNRHYYKVSADPNKINAQ